MTLLPYTLDNVRSLCTMKNSQAVLPVNLRQRKEVHPVTTGKEAELERTTRLRGFRYGLHDFLAGVGLDGPQARNDHGEEAHVIEPAVDRRSMEVRIRVS